MANLTGQKYGGRQKGTPNKITDDIRSLFEKLLTNNLKTLQSDIEALEPKDRIKAIMDMAKFIIPTLKAVEVEANVIDNDFSYEDALKLMRELEN